MGLTGRLTGFGALAGLAVKKLVDGLRGALKQLLVQNASAVKAVVGLEV